MDLKNVKNLVKLVEEADISHLCIEQDGMKIEVKKEHPVQHVSASVAPAPLPVAAPAPPATPTPAVDESNTKKSSIIEVKAEMVGTFYSAANPESEPFVRVGSKVKQGDVIYIIEAMKLFNEVESEVNGTIAEICVKNGEAVEFGQVLFRIEP